MGDALDAETPYEVLLVGTYHMANPGLDAFNLPADDVLTPRRQAEIEVVASRLAEFKPTKVAVEAPLGDAALGERFTAYVSGRHQLGPSEVEQLGFRVAACLGHPSVFPVDVSDRLYEPDLDKLAAEDPRQRRCLEEMTAAGERLVADQADWLQRDTVGEFVLRLNSPEVLRRLDEPYVRYLLPVAAGDRYPGPDMVANWYRRNLRIVANLLRVASQGDRLLVLYGMGHVPVLRRLLGDTPFFTLVDPLPYLAGGSTADLGPVG